MHRGFFSGPDVQIPSFLEAARDPGAQQNLRMVNGVDLEAARLVECPALSSLGAQEFCPHDFSDTSNQPNGFHRHPHGRSPSERWMVPAWTW